MGYWKGWKMYELIVLTLLMQGSAHGYLVIKVINDIIGPYTKVSNGRLYPLLTKLEAEGFIEASDEGPSEQVGGRHLRSFQITEAGRKRFHELMMNTISNSGDYQKLFLYKVQGMEFLQSSERLFLLDHYINFCQSHVLYLTARAEEIERRVDQETPRMSSIRMKATLNLIQHVANQWRLELEWANQMHEEEVDEME